MMPIDLKWPPNAIETKRQKDFFRRRSAGLRVRGLLEKVISSEDKSRSRFPQPSKNFSLITKMHSLFQGRAKTSMMPESAQLSQSAIVTYSSSSDPLLSQILCTLKFSSNFL